MMQACVRLHTCGQEYLLVDVREVASRWREAGGARVQLAAADLRADDVGADRTTPDSPLAHGLAGRDGGLERGAHLQIKAAVGAVAERVHPAMVVCGAQGESRRVCREALVACNLPGN